jgi:polyhydroxybutyrate depolymerase
MTPWSKIRHRFAVLMLCLAGAQTIPSDPAQAVTGRLTVEAGGQKRTAIFVEPERLKRSPRTAIIVLHGANNGSGRRVQNYLGLDESVRAAGAVVVYPDALEGGWNVTGDAGPDDPAFLRALAAKLVADGVADRRKIFLIGVSTGGMMALRVGCQSPDYLAGLGALIAGLPTKLMEGCKPPPLAFLLLNLAGLLEIIAAKQKAVEEGDLFDVLGVRRDSDAAAVKSRRYCETARAQAM